MKDLYTKALQKGLTFKHVCEVGVYKPETSNIKGFINSGIRTTLVEADPALTDSILSYYNKGNVTLHTIAIWDYNGTLKLSKANASTFASDLENSPAIANDNYTVNPENTFEVPCVKFSELDNGTIDLLSIDTEGCEWYVLKYLKSNPGLICLETHGKFYTNPFINEITAYMDTHGYVLWYKTSTDSIYVKPTLLKRSFAEKLNLKFQNLLIALRLQKKVLYRLTGRNR